MRCEVSVVALENLNDAIDIADQDKGAAGVEQVDDGT